MTTVETYTIEVDMPFDEAAKVVAAKSGRTFNFTRADTLRTRFLPRFSAVIGYKNFPKDEIYAHFNPRNGKTVAHIPKEVERGYAVETINALLGE